MLFSFTCSALLGFATAGTVNLTRANAKSELVGLGKPGGINIGGFKPLDPNLFHGVDLSGVDLSKIHTVPNLILRDRPLRNIKINDPLFGDRQVSYFVTSNNLAVIDGDVIYGPVSSLLAHRSGAKTKGKRAFSGTPTWPNAEVKYRYDSASTASKIQNLVNDAISDWQSAAPWLRFTRLPDSATWSNGILTITSNDCDGCHATLGYSANEALHMNLGTNAACGDSCGGPVALHEFGHVLGLHHEHQRPDREAHVQYHCENLAPLCQNGKFMKQNTNCCNNVEPECCKHVSDFGFIADASLDWSGAYDINSLMHYPGSLFALAGTNTLTSSNPAVPVPVSNAASVSPLDLERVCKRNVLQCKPVCKEIQCPPPCDIVKPCPNSKGCRPPDRFDPDWTPPPCCVGGDNDNDGCRQWKNKCKAHGCPSGPP
ncbi:MAG: hypothetical protein Q9167_000061 [Letrouitia subvulpina]